MKQSNGLSEDEANLREVLEGLLPHFAALDSELHKAANGVVKDLRRRAGSGKSDEDRPTQRSDSLGSGPR